MFWKKCFETLSIPQCNSELQVLLQQLGIAATRSTWLKTSTTSKTTTTNQKLDPHAKLPNAGNNQQVSDNFLIYFCQIWTTFHKVIMEEWLWWWEMALFQPKQGI
jgi:hypothetical protein